MKRYTLNFKKHRLFSLLCITIVLAVCDRPQDSNSNVARSDSTVMVSVPRLPLTIDHSPTAEERSLKAELDYYLERHDVQDDGFEMVAAYAANGDSLTSRLPKGRLLLVNVGRWRGIPRQGTGLERDARQRIIIGHYEADTLQSGVRVSGDTLYSGDFTNGLAGGHGASLSSDGTYYEGQWQNDERQGFGFAVRPFSHVRVGIWRGNKFLGEPIHYTSERIYGIDISRYQHGKGRKKYAINWRRLRITHLGSRQQSQVSGAVDYPVSFVFIKSTEGVKIRNPFFAKDYHDARRQGIPVGAYHFFSWKTSGTAQAQHFISNTLFRHGDLPPVLDVEPTAGQIAKMGGTEALFRHVRHWLQAVERHTGVKPLLYVSQSFVKKYLDDAPDLKRDYQVWIARYGEYRPDVKLAVWQLSPDGHVDGIRGDVDINVFNGYQTQFEEFVKTGIRR